MREAIGPPAHAVLFYVVQYCPKAPQTAVAIPQSKQQANRALKQTTEERNILKQISYNILLQERLNIQILGTINNNYYYARMCNYYQMLHARYRKGKQWRTGLCTRFLLPYGLESRLALVATQLHGLDIRELEKNEKKFSQVDAVRPGILNVVPCSRRDSSKLYADVSIINL